MNNLFTLKKELIPIESKGDRCVVKRGGFFSYAPAAEARCSLGVSRFSEGINLLALRTNLYFAVWKTII